jgi:glycosyltransferase involved in cell wall biosynthesis
MVDVCHETGSKVFLYVQNMWPFCTRLSLLDRWGGNCRDYESGRRCVACMENVVSSEAAKWRGRLPGLLWKSARIHGAVKRAYQASILRTRPRDLVESGTGYALRRQAYVEAISKADCVCYISRRTRELAEQFGVRSTRTLVAPVRLNHIHRVHSELAAHWTLRAINGSPIRFGYIGAHSPEKGIEVLLHAFAGLDRANATLDCHGAGGTEYIARLKRLTNAPSGIAFHGRYEQRQLSSILQNIDVGVVPSICEDTAPNTVLEFQAAGIPVLGSDIGGIPEQIDDGNSGALFEAGNVIALRQCMQRIIDNPRLISEWAAKLPGDFDPEPSWRQIEQVLCELAGSPAQTHQRSCIESR